jgi:HSP20 family molecular chaperone IbpA
MIDNEHLEIDQERIRRKYDENTKNWYFSVVDVIAIVSNSSDPRNYWKVQKSRLQKVNPQLVTKCNQLKLPSSDGKNYFTDVATSETLIDIIKAISLPHVKIFQLWFEKIESSNHQEKSFPQHESTGDDVAELSIDMYQKNGSLILETFVAGTNPEDIIIRTTYQDIAISGSRKQSENFKKEISISQEIFYGFFSRTIEFPLPVELDKIEASVSHGLLTITIPLIDIKRVRVIKIKST